MIKEGREPYLVLAGIVPGIGLCVYCRYAEWEGSFCEAELMCAYPLPVINGGEDDGEHCRNVWGGGDDCWGFPPRHDLQTCGIIVSIYAEGLMPHFGRGKWVGVIRLGGQ